VLLALVPECVDGFCYELNEEHRVWSEAQDDCRRKGGNLVSIASSYEQTTVQSKFSSFTNNANTPLDSECCY